MKINLDEESLELLVAFQQFQRNELMAIAAKALADYKASLVTSWSVAENNLNALTKAEKLLNYKLGSYTDTFVATYKTQFEQMIKDETARRTEGESYWRYVGPLDGVTRPQCVDGLTIEYFTDDEKNTFNSEGIRYRCRHTFDLITEEEYEKNI